MKNEAAFHCDDPLPHGVHALVLDRVQTGIEAFGP
jgi:hypothetical protein